jgi:hypothetical protein
LENKAKNSKFSNTFHRRLQDLKGKIAQDETTTEGIQELEISAINTYSALESKIDNIEANLQQMMTQVGNGTCKAGTDKENNQNSASKEPKHGNLDKKLELLEEEFKSEIEKVKNAIMDAQQAINTRADKIEKQIEEQNQKLETIEKLIIRMMRAFYINV